jgi:hypothetical protein
MRPYIFCISKLIGYLTESFYKQKEKPPRSQGKTITMANVAYRLTACTDASCLESTQVNRGKTNEILNKRKIFHQLHCVEAAAASRIE